jgi:outer membrane protein TolC
LILVALAAKVTLELWRSQRHAADSRRWEEVKSMKRNAALFVLAAMAFGACIAAGQEASNTAPPPRQITLQDAVQLALKHNHDIRIAGYTVEEKQHAKETREERIFSNDSK